MKRRRAMDKIINDLIIAAYNLTDLELIYIVLMIWIYFFGYRHLIGRERKNKSSRTDYYAYFGIPHIIGSEKYNFPSVSKSIVNDVMKKTEDAEILDLLYDVDKNTIADIVVNIAFLGINHIGDVENPYFTSGVSRHLNEKIFWLFNRDCINEEYDTYSSRFSGNLLLLAKTDPEISTDYSHEHLISIKGRNNDSLVFKVALTEMRSFGFFKDLTGTMTLVFDISDKRFTIIMEQDDLVLLEKQAIIWENRIKEKYEKRENNKRDKS